MSLCTVACFMSAVLTCISLPVKRSAAACDLLPAKLSAVVVHVPLLLLLADIMPGQGLYYTALTKSYRAKNCLVNSYGVSNTTYGLTPSPCRDCEHPPPFAPSPQTVFIPCRTCQPFFLATA
jgi:hypothetical protein